MKTQVLLTSLSVKLALLKVEPGLVIDSPVRSGLLLVVGNSLPPDDRHSSRRSLWIPGNLLPLFHYLHPVRILEVLSQGSLNQDDITGHGLGGKSVMPPAD